MEWSEIIKANKEKLSQYDFDHIPLGLIERIYGLIDLTRLNEQDDVQRVLKWSQAACSQLGRVAGICVYPQFTRLIATEFADKSIYPVTVANFPKGDSDIETVLVQIEEGLEAGAKEIDIVFPHQRYLAGEIEYATSFVSSCKAACGEVVLKIILETGALQDANVIANACRDVIDAGADFVKTSTGKTTRGVTPADAIILLSVIKEKSQKNKSVGLKVSGGVREPQEAAAYLALADEIMGREWVSKHTFRIGASQLVDHLLKIVEVQ